MRYREFVTTNLRLPKEYLRALKEEALRKEKSVSFLMRELVKQYIQPRGLKMQEEKRSKPRSIWDFPKLAKKTGDSHLALKVDRIVYGDR